MSSSLNQHLSAHVKQIALSQEQISHWESTCLSLHLRHVSGAETVHVPRQVLGTPMIPCMMMVLGAVLHKGPGSAHVPARLILGVSAFRLIIIPLTGEAPLPACQL